MFKKRASNLNDQLRRVNSQPPMLGPLTIRDAEATVSKHPSVYYIIARLPTQSVLYPCHRTPVSRAHGSPFACRTGARAIG